MKLAEETWGILASPPLSIRPLLSAWRRLRLYRRARNLDALSHIAWARNLVEEPMLSWQEFACPTCCQPAGQRCVARGSGKSTSTHVARIRLRTRKYGWAEMPR